MSGLKSLIKLIDEKCATWGGYNEILLRDCLVAYTLLHNIYVGTQDWHNMINLLWYYLDTQLLIGSFDTKENFESYIAHDLT